MQSQTWITADIDIVKDRPQLLSVIDVLEKRHINTYTPTNWDDVFPGMVEPDFDYTEIVDAIEKDDLVAASDGSVMKNKGGAAFCLARKDGTILYQYSTRVHGDVGDIHSTRTEMVDILGIVVFLRKLERRHKFTKKPVIEIFSDSAMAIKAATEKCTSLSKMYLKMMLTSRLNYDGMSNYASVICSSHMYDRIRAIMLKLRAFHYRNN